MTIRNVKIRVNSKAESAAIQSALFQDGCEWSAGGRFVQYTDKPFLYVDDGRYITFGNSEIRFNEDGSHRELKFQFVTTVKAVPEVRKTVSLFGKLYDAEELQTALDTLKPVTV